MARKRQNSTLESDIDDAVGGWMGITRSDDLVEWQAWTDWRRKFAGAMCEPDGLTVPTPFPPQTVQAANDYLEVVRKMRRLVGHREGIKRISNDPYAYRTDA